MAKPEGVGYQVVESSVSHKPDHPSPCDLDVYLPWACGQLECEFTVSVLKVTQSEYVTVNVAKKDTKVKPKKIQSSSSNDDTKNDDKKVQSGFSDEEEGTIKMYAIYDQLDHLVELKFDKNPVLPRLLFKILGLIIPFQKHLLTITIPQGMDMYCLYEINKFLPTCSVTDLCFDGTYLKDGSFSILFENFTSVKRVSLSRCRIDDRVLETIASKLVNPLPASKTLVVLDLSMNRITDEGAKYMAYALRTNRCLSYLNLSDNRLTDTGGELLLGSLMNFALTEEELDNAKQKLMKYHLEKKEFVTRILKELRVEQLKGRRKTVIKPLIKPAVSKKGKGVEREGSLKAMSEDKVVPDMDSYLYDRACIMAEVQMGTFNDPYSRDNLVTRDGIVYCLGNNALCYLNLSYNNLTFIFLKKLLKVITTQKITQRKPQGIIKVVIDGNYLPESCIEMLKIESLLDTGISDKNIVKKRPGSKSVAAIR